MLAKGREGRGGGGGGGVGDAHRQADGRAVNFETQQQDEMHAEWDGSPADCCRNR